jgi:integrase
MGYLYRPKLKSGRHSGMWWVKYYQNGRPVRESTGVAADTETPPQEAKRFLKEREGRVATGQPILPRADRIRYEEAAADLRAHYKATGDRDLHEAEKRLAHLDTFFTGRRLVAIGGAEATAYVGRRQAERAANGTINRELAVLTKMLRLAYEHGKLLRLPVIRKLKEASPRAGFCELDVFMALRKRLPEPHGLAVAICYTLAWRRAEVFGLEWRHVDLERGVLRLDAERSKTDEGREAVLPPPLLAELRAHRTKIEALQRKLERVIPQVFVRLRGKLAGVPIGDFRKRWVKACAAVGVPGLLVHDLRRSGVRNMVRAGISEGVAMKISGHRTRSVFDRYNVTSAKDLEAAARVMGTFSGTFRQS